MREVRHSLIGGEHDHSPQAVQRSETAGTEAGAFTVAHQRRRQWRVTVTYCVVARRGCTTQYGVGTAHTTGGGGGVANPSTAQRCHTAHGETGVGACVASRLRSVRFGFGGQLSRTQLRAGPSDSGGFGDGLGGQTEARRCPQSGGSDQIDRCSTASGSICVSLSVGVGQRIVFGCTGSTAGGGDASVVRCSGSRVGGADRSSQVPVASHCICTGAVAGFGCSGRRRVGQWHR